jgi:hypothetical protein
MTDHAWMNQTMLPPELSVAPLLPRHGRRTETLPIKKLAQLIAEIQRSRLTREQAEGDHQDVPAAEFVDDFDPRD